MGRGAKRWGKLAGEVLAIAILPCSVAHAARVHVVSESSAGILGNGDAVAPALSARGGDLSFFSLATNLDANPNPGVFVYDRKAGQLQRLSVGVPAGCCETSISDDGRFVASAGKVYDRVLGTVDTFPDLLTVMSADAGTIAQRSSSRDALTLYDRVTRASQPVVDLSGTHRTVTSGELSPDGRWFVFGSDMAFPHAGQNFNVYAFRAATGRTSLVSASPSGEPNDGSFVGDAGDSTITFSSGATNLLPGPDTNGPISDVFTYDRGTHALEIDSTNTAGVQANGNSSDPVITPDGRFVAFESGATNLGAPSKPGRAMSNIFVHDRNTGETRLVSTTWNGDPIRGFATSPAISANGRWVAFVSGASNLVRGVSPFGTWQLFVAGPLTWP